MTRRTKATGASGVGHKNVVSAVATAIYDRFSSSGQLKPVPENIRLDGKTCLVTGANSGLGRAVATQLAARGGNMILVCRPGHEEVVEEIQLATGNPDVRLMTADLADMASVASLCDRLRDQNVRLDIAVLNAGLMPLQARKSPQGYELMFAVHFLANRLLAERWWQDGVIQPATDPARTPRLVFVSSEAHQSSPPIDFDRFGAFTPYGLKDGMKFYGQTKLHLCTLASELSRRLNSSGRVQVAVHALCPGPIASNIARESPVYIKPILKPIMKTLFRSPEQAAEPVIYLACADEMGQRSGVYLHMMKEKLPSARALDPLNGEQLWVKSEALIAPYIREVATA
ncbi:MAG: SDR family NAD(P)-dependent oxidoreductase [Ketobacteraceae bacterium]|nr:SDR family NAD(P)-dependent oxidoreductase [Ketobacteraceae bacterium]